MLHVEARAIEIIRYKERGNFLLVFEILQFLKMFLKYRNCSKFAWRSSSTYSSIYFSKKKRSEKSLFLFSFYLFFIIPL